MQLFTGAFIKRVAPRKHQDVLKNLFCVTVLVLGLPMMLTLDIGTQLFILIGAIFGGSKKNS